MEEQKFKPGDIVQLNSGGPEMTVSGYDPKDSLNVTCAWFSGNELKERSFLQDLLSPYEPFDITDIY